MLAAVMCGAYAPPASALDLNLNPEDYLKIEYDPITFDKTSVTAGETFSAVIRGRAVCIRSLPFSPSQAIITWRVIARHKAGGDSLTLSQEYAITIKPFPRKKGQTFEIDQKIPLQMPPGAEPGEYAVIWQLVEAKVKILFLWQGVTGSFPGEQNMGTVQVIVPEPVITTPQAEPAAVEAPQSSTPSPASPSSPPPAEPEQPVTITITTPAHEPVPERNMPWWAWLLIFVAIVTVVANVIRFISRRRKKG